MRFMRFVTWINNVFDVKNILGKDINLVQECASFKL